MPLPPCQIKEARTDAVRLAARAEAAELHSKELQSRLDYVLVRGLALAHEMRP